MNKLKSYLISGAITLLLAIGFIGGWKSFPRFNPYPIVTTVTEYVYDTVIHNIPNDIHHYSVKDSIIYTIIHDTIPADTAAIVKDWQATRKYDREFKDTNIVVNLTDYVTHNRLMDNFSFNYELLNSQTITYNNVDETTIYNSYFQVGLGVPFKNINCIQLEANYIFPKGYAGAYWMPELKSLGAKVGVTIIKFKSRK